MKLKTLKDLLEDACEASQDEFKLGYNYGLKSTQELGKLWYEHIQRTSALQIKYEEKNGVYEFIKDFFGVR